MLYVHAKNDCSFHFLFLSLSDIVERCDIRLVLVVVLLGSPAVHVDGHVLLNVVVVVHYVFNVEDTLVVPVSIVIEVIAQLTAWDDIPV